MVIISCFQIYFAHKLSKRKTATRCTREQPLIWDLIAAYKSLCFHDRSLSKSIHIIVKKVSVSLNEDTGKRHYEATDLRFLEMKSNRAIQISPKLSPKIKVGIKSRNLYPVVTNPSCIEKSVGCSP